MPSIRDAVMHSAPRHSARIASSRLPVVPSWPVLVSLLIALLLAGCASVQRVGALLTNRIAFSEAQLQSQLDRHYPRSYPQFGGLVTLSVLNPRIAVPREGDRLHLDFDVGATGFGLGGDAPAGHLSLTSALRYDARTHALYLDAPTLESAELPLVGDRINGTGRDLINRWLREQARTEPVYTLESAQLRELGSRRVSSVGIENGKVVVRLDD